MIAEPPPLRASARYSSACIPAAPARSRPTRSGGGALHHYDHEHRHSGIAWNTSASVAHGETGYGRNEPSGTNGLSGQPD